MADPDDRSRQSRAELQQRVKIQIKTVQTILRSWDPIGIAPGSFAPADEYDSYAPQIVSRVLKGCTAEDLTDHLGYIRTQVIGLEANASQDRVTALEILNALRTL